MRIATVSHSHVALRQQLFFREMAFQGHEVLMVAPGEWGNLGTKDQYMEYLYDPDPNMGPRVNGRFQLKTCRHMFGEDIYQYHLLGAKDLSDAFEPDWLYIQAEPGSTLAEEAVMWKAKKRATFTWENIALRGGEEALKKYDLVVCGNSDAEKIMERYNPNRIITLQVGVDTDHFQARPNVERNVEVAYIGRMSPEKGLPYLAQAWPGVRIIDWTPFDRLPWMYSQVQVVVAFSQDVPHWREQAPNYVVLEALSCGCKVVTSDTAAMGFWLEGRPGVIQVKGHKQPDADLRLERIYGLRDGIQRALEVEVGNEAREWVKTRFSNRNLAHGILEAFEYYG